MHQTDHHPSSAHRARLVGTALLLLVTAIAATAWRSPVPAAAATPTIASLTAGGNTGCSIDTTGTAGCWGGLHHDASDGALPGTWTQLSAGAWHSCGIRTDATATCWGDNTGGRAPGDLPGTWTQVVAGAFHSCGIRTDATATCWGNNTTGQAPNTIPGTWRAIAVGGVHTCGIHTDLTLRCWGETHNGRAPALVTGAWADVTAGQSHTCGLRTDGTIRCWGHNGSGQAPETVPGTWTQITAGSLHNCGIRTDDTIGCWGGTDTQTPENISGTWSKINSRFELTCGIRTDGTATCWGRSDYGATGPIFTSGPPLVGLVGSSYEHTFTAATPATFSITDGALPPGLDLAPDGSLAGTPTATGTFTATVTSSHWLISHHQSVSITIHQPPTADAGPDQTVNGGTTVTLDGTGSTDPEAGTLTYAWAQTSGPTVTLTKADTATASFTAPTGPATLAFTLTVTDPHGASATDNVTISVNGSPLADAGDDRVVNNGQSVTLDGTGSSDPDSDQLTYAWSQTSGPAITVSGADTSDPTFTAPTGPATLTFELTVTDPGGLADTDTVTIRVNGIPTANAGPNQTVHIGDTVVLDASASTDPDDDELTYTWTQTAGPTVTLTGANTAQATFTAPDPTRPAVTTVTTFSVSVTDPWGATNQATVVVTATPDLTPNETWVATTYATFLHRPPTTGDLDYWAGRLDNGTPRQVLARQIALSHEATAGPLLTQIYNQALNRNPSPEDRTYWADQLRNGYPLHQLTRHLHSTTEAFNNAGATNDAWTTRLYQTLLGRTPTAGEHTYWTNQLDNGTPRHTITNTIQNTPEARRHIINTQTLAILGRTPTPTEMNTLDTQLRTTKDPRQTAITITTWLP